MISGVLQANNGCSSVDALQVRIKLEIRKSDLQSYFMMKLSVIRMSFFMDNHDRCTGSCGRHKKDQQKQVRIVSGIGAL